MLLYPVRLCTPPFQSRVPRLQHDSNVVIAKLDATTNDIPSPKMSVRGYPTLIFTTAKGDGELGCSGG